MFGEKGVGILWKVVDRSGFRFLMQLVTLGILTGLGKNGINLISVNSVNQHHTSVKKKLKKKRGLVLQQNDDPIPLNLRWATY